MAKAISALLHSRNKLCDISFYSFLFASILAPSAANEQSGINMSFGRFEEEHTPEENRQKLGITQNNDNSAEYGIEECYKILEEISIATSTPLFITRNNGHQSANLDNRVRKIANSLMEILNLFKFNENYSMAIQTAIITKDNS
jgi:hypothetical protein